MLAVREELMDKIKPDFGRGSWRANVVDCGYHITPKKILVEGSNPDMRLALPYQAFLLSNDNTNILIDNGMNECSNKYGDMVDDVEFFSTSEQFLKGLKKHGLLPEDIDTVIYTHMHSDHAGNAKYFSRTRTIIQRDELFGALNPCFKEKQLRLYDPSYIQYVQNNPNLLMIDGDINFMEGIRIIKTPGHSRGHQSLVVNTVNGVRVFAGDALHLTIGAFPYLDTIEDYFGNMHKVTPMPEWPIAAASLAFNYYDYYASAEKLKAHMPEDDPKYLICGHDASLARRDF
jgi:glyoxylase-like metal-dependent hydrolase (beta-lactamase superfamily II)